MQGKVNNYTPPGSGALLKAPTVVSYEVPAGAEYTVTLSKASPDANTAPAVSAGSDRTGIPLGLDPIKLSGSARDDGLGSPNGTLVTKWTVVSTPDDATATIDATSSLTPTVTVSAAGTYVFRLAGSDGELESSDDVAIKVDPLEPLPASWVAYDFDTVSGSSVPDTSGNNNDLTLHGAASEIPGDTSPVLHLDGSDGGYAQLPADILSRSKDLTISTWVKLDTIGQFSRIFDFGSDQNNYLCMSWTRSTYIGQDSVDLMSRYYTLVSVTDTMQPYAIREKWHISLTVSCNADGTSTPVTIESDTIRLTPDVAYLYELDTMSKTMTFSFGKLEGHARYWFEDDRSRLVIVDGEGYTAVNTFIEDFERIVTGFIVRTGGSSVQLPEGQDVIVLSRTPTAAPAQPAASTSAAAVPPTDGGQEASAESPEPSAEAPASSEAAAEPGQEPAASPSAASPSASAASASSSQSSGDAAAKGRQMLSVSDILAELPSADEAAQG
jgi:hypothetical protein